MPHNGRARARHREHRRRRNQSQFREPRRQAGATAVAATTPREPGAPTIGELQERARNAQEHALNNRSRRTYSTGQRHWARFTAKYGGDELEQQPLDMQLGLFVTNLITVKGIKPQTANQYVSHVIKTWIEERRITHSDDVRTPYLATIIDGFERIGRVGKPIRDETRIALTYPLLLIAIRIIDEQYSENEEQRIAIRAAFALGYGLSLRPGEYLKLFDERRPDEQALTGNVSLWWGNIHFDAHEAEKFPTGPADRLTLAVDFLKNDQLGKGLPRALAKAPRAVFCCLTAIEAFIRNQRLNANDPFLTTSEGQVHWKTVREILDSTARASGVDPKRLTPQGIRAGAVNQLDAHAHPTETLERQGGWTSTGGLRSYLRTNFRHAERVVEDMHDVDAIPIAHTRHMFAGGQARNTSAGGHF